MHIPRLYIPQTLAENTSIELEPAAAHHITKVLRMKPGRKLIIFNGQVYRDAAGEFSAVIASIEKKRVMVELTAFVPRQTESSLAIELGVCIIKPDRMDWLLQKACELGVNTVAPLWSEYTDVKLPAERLEKKLHHWRQVLISASEQSGRTRVPALIEPQPLAQWTSTVKADQCRVLHPYVQSSSQTVASPSSLALLVGPEGGLSDAEVELALDQGFAPMTLGPRILRAETAPLAAISLLQSQYGDW